MKLIVRVMVALLTFIVGVTSSQLWSMRQRKVVQTTPVLTLKVIEQPAIFMPSQTWRRIVVKGRFSFYIPPDFNDDGRHDSGPIASGVFRKELRDGLSGLFYLDYYSDTTTDNDPRNAPNRYRSTIRSEVMIGGKRATMITAIPTTDEISCIHDNASLQVYFPDIGRGRKLHISLASYGAEGIEVAKQIIDSIEFLDPIASNPGSKQARR